MSKFFIENKLDMYLLYELKNKTIILNIINLVTSNILKKSLNYNIDKIKINDIDKKDKKIFLLDDERFNFYSFVVNKIFEKKITISDLKKIIDEKKNEININYWKPWIFILYSIWEITINNVEDEYIIWKSWIIKFRINFVYLNNTSVLSIKNILWNNFTNDLNLKILPNSFHTIHFLKEKLNKNNLNIVYIEENEIKLIIIENWFYSKIIKFWLWIDKLKSIFKDNNLSIVYYQTYKTNDFNDFTLNLINESFNFYINLLIKWLKENLWNWQDCIIISNLLENEFFIKTFNNEYTKNIKWFVLPFNYWQELNNIWKKWEPNKIDILITINNM